MKTKNSKLLETFFRTQVQYEIKDHQKLINLDFVDFLEDEKEFWIFQSHSRELETAQMLLKMTEFPETRIRSIQLLMCLWEENRISMLPSLAETKLRIHELLEDRDEETLIEVEKLKQLVEETTEKEMFE